MKTLLKEVFGYDRFRPGQEELIERTMAGKNSLVVMPTGGGKSICYQIPSILRQGTGIVISPLISLMQDQVDALLQLGVKAAFLNSSLGKKDQQDIERRLMNGGLDLLYVSPERLMTPNFLQRLEQCRIALFAIDEAHCISQWGHDFRPEYQQLREIRNRFPDVPCIAVTATADGPTQRDILRNLDMDEEDLFVHGFDRPNIRYTVTLKHNVRQQLLRFIQTEHQGNAGIVYCLSRSKVEELAEWLTDLRCNALPYHAGLPAARRSKAQETFLREEGVIIVATVAFGMGIDKPNVRFVAHVDIPRSPEAYYQETGRAGRDGLPADAWMAYSVSDVVILRKMLEESGMDGPHKWVERHKLDAMTGFCETTECRRNVLLRYFGEKPAAPCGNCDNCLNPVETWDGTIEAQKVISCIHRTGQRFGAGHVIDVLTGKATEKVSRFGHERLTTFGVGADRSETEWRSVLRQLIAADVVKIDMEGFGVLKLTSACAPIVKGGTRVYFRQDPNVRAPGRKKKKKASVAATGFHSTLFEALKAKRLELAREQQVPPYVIFHDSTLLAMSEQRPRSTSEFAAVPGVGEAKLARYADIFLEVIRNHS